MEPGSFHFNDSVTNKRIKTTDALRLGQNVCRPGDADGTTAAPLKLCLHLLSFYSTFETIISATVTNRFVQPQPSVRGHMDRTSDCRKGRRRSLHSVSETTSFFYSEPDHHETPQRQQDVVKQPRTMFISNLKNIIKVFITC